MNPTTTDSTAQHITGNSDSMPHVDGFSGLNEASILSQLHFRAYNNIPPTCCSQLKLVNDADNIKGWVIPPIANSLSIARPDNWDTVPGATGVLDGTQNQGLDVEHSGQKEAGIEDRAARAHGKRTKRYCVDNSGGKCLRDEVKFGSKIQKTIATFDTVKTTVGGEDFKEAGRSFSILTCGS
ncbi:hypothetical protein R3P38DRAFT_3222522 [Favolaschia claudopus]|uniref:Uncharacterized protein n=1 Tax=Favolaschia claudopus TaxID=2862362 RepID=A0AAW0A064_9AGAR